ncbi:uncharacterized N-acetyltransferase p20-like [Macadamia integrifolia]|uniref:uncharacterized N-acetyltransferase p20-like n=1 Tax=Macadamia integrifolia TaxID=60698 RepID=UPI001C500EBF|nr:uncharacterized N-acetyltransferase p20-like [Macadamia integrifolia]
MEGASPSANQMKKRWEEQISESNISLRPLQLSDLDAFMAWASDDQVSRFCTWNTYTSKEAALNYIKDTVLPHPWYRAICFKNQVVGGISVNKPKSGDDSCRRELAYGLAAKYWGRGIATQAVKLVVSSIFKECPYLIRLEAMVDVDNIGSQRVLEKAGFHKEGVLRKYIIVKGRIVDVVMYSFLSTELKLVD